jgi:signal transduction histidine kinase
LTTLRSRLFLTHLALVSLTLVIIGGALIVLASNNPATRQQAFRHIADVARASLPYLLNGGADQIDSRLADVAAENDVRIIRLSPNGLVELDTTGSVQAGSSLKVDPERDNAPNAQIQRGTFVDDQGEEWLALTLSRPNAGSLIFASLRPRSRIVSAIGDTLITPLLEAGAIGVILSIIFSVLISDWVSRPLAATATAVRGIEAGDFGKRAPEKGPAEVKELARSLNQMSDQVQQSRQQQRDFLANVSHELKTPLTSIQGFAQAILDGAAAIPGDAAQVIYDEAGRMRRLVEELLDLARIESGQTILRREIVNLSDLLFHIVKQFEIRAAEQTVTLTTNLSPVANVVGDPDRLAQVFTNLLENALTHTPDGGTVTVSCAPAPGGVQAVVQDTGKGIPAEDISRIFERFYQADKSRTRSDAKGTGLGLTISKEIVTALGGTISVESRDGHGAAMYIWLPLPRQTDQTAMNKRR